MKKYVVDHVCILTKEMDNLLALFKNVFGMEIVRSLGEAPARKIWLDGGVQINEAAEFEPTGGMDHLAINVPEAEHEEIFKKAAEYGCKQVEGMKQYQWIYLPEGQMVELTNITQKLNAEKA